MDLTKNLLAALALLLPTLAYSDCPTLKETELSRAAIVAMINNPDCGIGSVENILSWIERPYFSNYALVYRSRSLQGPHRVDYLNPRAIVYGTDQGFNLPNLIMAFNGSSAQPGFNSLEMMELNVNAPSIEGLFNFFEVEFPGSGSPGPIRVSAFNPPKCIRCHGSPAKPVFDSYPFWPGVFGSMRFPTPHVINLESTHYSNFISRAARHSRYQFLTPYKQESSCVGSDCSFLSYYPPLERSAAALNGLLAQANTGRSVALIMNSPEYRKTKFSFAAALLECPAWPRSIPDSIRASLDENMERLFSLQQNMSEPRIDRFLRKAYANDGNIELPSHSFYKFEELLQFLAGYFGPYPNYRRLEFDTLIKQGLHQDALMPGALRLLMEGRGLRLSHWLLPFKNETYRIHDGGIVESDGWLKSLLNKDPELQPDLPQVLQLLEGRAHDIPWDNSLCEKWFGLSQAAMARLNVPILRAPSQTRDEYPRAFTQRCAHCHVAGSDAPAIPFAHEGWMGRWLGHSKNRKLLASRIKAETGRPMPPNQLLAPADRVEIFNYLEKFE